MGIITKRASGVINSIATTGTTQVLTVTMDDTYTLADEVGRIIYITDDNNSQGRYREITAFTSTTITVDAPFGESTDTTNIGPFRSLEALTTDTDSYSAVNERPIAATNTFAISRTLAEAAALTGSDIIDNTVGETKAFRMIGSEVSFGDGVVVYDKDAVLEMDYQDSVRILPGSALILGKQNFGDTTREDVLGYTSDSCTVIDTSVGYIPSGNEDRGAFHMNGGVYRGTATSGQGTFLRFNGNSTVGSADQMRQSLRFWGVMVLGRFGGRVSGNYSVLLDNTTSGNFGSLGFMNPLAIAISQGTKITNSLQAFYISTQLGGSTTLGATEVQDLFASGSTSPRVFNINSSTGGTVQSINDWDLGAMDALTTGDSTVSLTGGNTNSSRMDWNKNYKLDFTNTDGSAITDINGKVRIHEQDGTVTSAGTIDTVLGDCPVQLLRKYFHTLGGARPNFQSATVTEETPYSWAALFRNSNLVVGQTDLLGPVGGIELSFPIVDDINITQTDTSLVDAYTELGSDGRLYDYSYKFKEDNMEMPTLQTMPFVKTGNIISPTTAGENFSFANTFNTPLGYTAATSDWLINIPITGYDGGIETTGNVFFDRTIIGDVEANTIDFTGTQPTTAIDTSGKVKGTLSLADGTYIIRGGADVSELTINADVPANNAVIITLEDAQTTVGDNSLVLGTGVSSNKVITVTMQLDEDYDEDKLKKFRWVGASSPTDYGTKTKKDHNDDDVTITPNNTLNSVDFAFTIDVDDSLYFYIAYEGYEHDAVQGDDITNATITPIPLTTSQIDFTAVAVADSDDETLEGLTPTVGSTAAGGAFTAVTNDIFFVVPTTAALPDITGNFDKKFVWRAMHENTYVDGVLQGFTPFNPWKFEVSSLRLNFVTDDTDELRFLGNFIKESATTVIQFASRVINASEKDLRATISSADDTTLEVRFGINASGASGAEVNAIVKNVYLNDTDVQGRQEEISQITYFAP